MSEITEQIKGSIDIVDLIGSYVPLKKDGSSYKGLCPFHAEKTPSFRVNPQKQIFHCFGCGAGGDVIEFVKRHENVDFPGAVSILAKKAGIESSEGNGKNNRFFKINAEAQQFYADNLRKNAKILAYLTDTRGLTMESIERFQLGCTNGISVSSVLRNKGYKEKDILDVGLARKKEGALHDVFWKRVMFPISVYGKIRAFGGRVVYEGTPKYLNTAETSIFHKKDILYGLDPVGIKDRGYALIGEGYLDVIVSHQHGFRNTVAPLGTALSMDHVKLLKKYCDRVYPVFDGDEAGRRAALKAAEFLFREKMKGGIVVLPDGEDPDSFLRKGGDLEPLITAAVPFSVHIARERPKMRRKVLDHLFFRSPLETAEFLAYGGSPEEIKMSLEMSARAGIEKIFRNEPFVVRKDAVEVKKHKDFLALFSSKRFRLLVDVTGDHKQQANRMMKEYLLLGRKLAKTVKK